MSTYSANQFSNDLFTSLMNERANKDKNLFISGLSLFVALLVATSGAQGNTLREMVSVLYRKDQNENSLEYLNEYLKCVINGALKGNVDLANGIFVQERYYLESSYADSLMEVAGTIAAKCQSLDFNKRASLQVVNKWVQEVTHGKIQNILQTPLPERMILINAIYFKKKWKYQFDKALTENDWFFKSARNSVDVPMMKVTQKELLYGENSFARWVHLPYHGDQCDMVFVLPLKVFALQSVKDNLRSINFNDSTKRKMNTFALPKFKVEYYQDVKKTLGRMGMVSAFNDRADFGSMSQSPGLRIDQVVHKTLIVVDEEGYDATSTVTEVKNTKPIDFIVNEPFLFFIRHIPSGLVLFHGQVSAPKYE